MSISEAVLFVASNSSACKQCLQFVSQHRMPMQIVRLDTESSRKTAANGRFFQITMVPTMVIMYEDGNTQLFLGTPKIIQWLTALIKASKERERIPEPAAARHQEQNMYGPISTAYPVAKSRRPIVDQGEDIEDQPMYEPPQPARRAPVVVEEDYPEEPLLEIEEEPEVEEEQPKPRNRTKKGKSRQQKPVEEEGSTAAKRRMAKEKLNKAASAKGKPLSSKMKDVYNMAKQMEEDAKISYGYKEEDLPHY